MLIGRQVTVLGAGIGGLTAALALALRGAQVTVRDQAAALADVGAGIQLGPNALAVLDALGVDVRPLGMAAQAVQLCAGASGQVLAALPVGDLPGGCVFLHRADLVAALAQAAQAAGVRLLLGAGVAVVDLTGDSPRLDGAPADLLIGADGLHSPTRAALTGKVAPFFTHQTAFRALIPGDPSDAPVAEVHLAPGCHLVSYPLRGGRLRNIVAVQERRDWVAEGWSQPGDPALLRAAFAGFSPRVRGWLAQVESCGLWGLFRHDVARIWGRALPQGAVAILGDAVHPMLPFLAQGAAMAIEDAWVLADAFAAPGDAQAITAYQSRRQARCSRVVAAANANARLYHLRGPMRPLAHLGLRAIGSVAPGRLLARYDWLYRADVTRS